MIRSGDQSFLVITPDISSAPAGTRTQNLLIISPYTADYTKCNNVILTNIYSILIPSHLSSGTE